jgi:HlyD family secretion protein
VITVPNTQLKLKPGMTANVTVEVLRRNNVLRVANAATRFRPTAEMFSVLNQPTPPELQRTGGRGNSAGTTASGQTHHSANQAAVVPAKATATTTADAVKAVQTKASATTIDALFGPLATTESRGTVWEYNAAKQLVPLRLRLGASDGTYSEVLNEADVPADAQVVTAMKTGLEPASASGARPTTTSGNPLMGGGPPAGRGGGRGF